MVGGKATALISSGQVRLETLPYHFLFGPVRSSLQLRSLSAIFQACIGSGHSSVGSTGATVFLG